MSLPIDPRNYELNQKLAEVLERLEVLNIKFTNDSPNAQTATLFNINQQIINQDLSNGNSGVSYQNAILGANLPSNLTTDIYSTPDYLFAGTDQGVWIYDRNANIGQLISSTINNAVAPELLIEFDAIANADLLVGDAHSVADWNTFLGLPANGNTFKLVVVTGNFVNLTGGSGITFKNSLFALNTNILSIVDTLGAVVELDYACLGLCTALTKVSFPNVTTAGDYCFTADELITSLSMPLLVSAGIGCFDYCIGLTTLTLPSCTTGAFNAFAEMSSVLYVSMPKLTSAGGQCFFYAISAVYFNLPLLSTIGDYCFRECTSMQYLQIPACTALGTTTGDDGVFLDITGNSILVIIPTAIATDGDMVYLEANNTVTVVTEVEFVLMWDDIANADLLVGDASDVDDWVAFFDLPTYGTAFTSVVVTGNVVSLRGGSGIEIKDDLFYQNTHLEVVVDGLGCIIQIDGGAFMQCTALLYVYFPKCLLTLYHIGDPFPFDYAGAFRESTALVLADLPLLTRVSSHCFFDCVTLAQINIQSCVGFDSLCFYGCGSLLSILCPIARSVGIDSFNGCNSLVEVYLPLVTTVLTRGFRSCTSLTTISLPIVTDIYIDECFDNCISLVNIYLPSCAMLGLTSGDDHVFDGITGNIIQLTVNKDLLINNSGDPDGDIIYLQQNNTVNIYAGLLPLLGASVNKVYYDEVNFKLYIATDGGGFCVYDLEKQTLATYNTTTVVTGDSLPSDTVLSITVDTVNDIIYAGTDAGLWKFDLATTTGTLFNTAGGVGSGDELPSNTVQAVIVDYTNDYVWAGTDAGVWRYNSVTGAGKIYNTVGGAGSGDQLPSNDVTSLYAYNSVDIVFAGTASGVWQYVPATDTGTVINTSTIVTGDAMPSDTVTSVFYDAPNGILYVGTDAGIWIYDMIAGSGKVYDTTVIPTIGVALPDNDVTGCWYESDGSLAVSTNGGGIWLLDISTDYGQVYQVVPAGAGSLPSSVVYGVAVCTASNLVYLATLGGMYVWNVNTNTGQIFTNAGGATSGDQLPSNICVCIYYDQTNDQVWVGTTLGLWRYDVATGVGTAFTVSGGIGSGDQLPNNFVHGVYVDESTDKVYVGTDGGFLIFDTVLDTGQAFTTVAGAGSGDQLPYNVCTDCIKYTGSDYVWVITSGGGLWQYDEVLDVGAVFDAINGGAGSGDQIPSNIGWSLAIESNIVWVATNLGIWKYTISTDTGLVINTSTAVTSGVGLPENAILSLALDATNNVLYVGLQNLGLWQWDIDLDTGTLYNVTGGQTTGTALPENIIESVFVDTTNDNLWAGTKGGGIWQYILNNEGIIGSASIVMDKGLYDYISQTIDIINAPIVIFMMKITITGSLTYNNIIRYTSSDPYGVGYQRVIRIGDYISALLNNSENVIDIPIPDGIIVSKDRYFEYPLDPWEVVDITFYYTRLEIADVIRGKINEILLHPFDELIDEIEDTEDDTEPDTGEIKPEPNTGGLAKPINLFWFIVGGIALLILISGNDKK